MTRRLPGEFWPEMSKDVEIVFLKELLGRALIALEKSSTSMTNAREFQAVIEDIHEAIRTVI